MLLRVPREKKHLARSGKGQPATRSGVSAHSATIARVIRRLSLGTKQRPDKSAPAKRLSPEERREQILTAVVPVIAEFGAATSSKQLADAAGVSEGTIFRVFDDKLALFRAVFRQEAEAAYRIDSLASQEFENLDAVTRAIVETCVERIGRFMTIAPALLSALRADHGHDDFKHGEQAHVQFIRDIAALIEPFASELRVPTTAAATTIAAVATTAAHVWGLGDTALDSESAIDILLHGISNTARPAPPPAAPLP